MRVVMQVFEEIKTQEGIRIQFKKGCLVVKWPLTPPTDQDMDEFMAAMTEAAARRMSAVVDVRGAPIPNASQRRFASEWWASDRATELKKVAFIEDHVVKKGIVTILMKFGNARPARFFSGMREAMEWVEQD